MYPQYSQDILPIGLVGKIQWADTVTVKVGAEQGSGRKPLSISGSWFCFCPRYFTCNILILSTCCCRLHYFRRLRSWIVFSFPNVVQRLITSRSSPLHGIIRLLTAHDLISHDSFGERWPYLPALRWGKVKLLKYDEREKSLEFLNTKKLASGLWPSPPKICHLGWRPIHIHTYYQWFPPALLWTNNKGHCWNAVSITTSSPPWLETDSIISQCHTRERWQYCGC